MSLPPVHPRAISGLRNFFHDYFQAVRELGLDQTPEQRRHLPEFFLTFSEHSAPPLTLHIYPDGALQTAGALEDKIRALFSPRLEPHVRATLHEISEREGMYQGFQRGGQTLYLHPAALRRLSQLPVARDAYGVIHLTLLWAHLVSFGLLALLLLLAEGGFLENLLVVGFYGVLLLISYFLLTLPLRLSAVQKALGGGRQRAFAAILADCQPVGRRALDEHLAAELPAGVLTRLNQLPERRPQPLDVLIRDEWRLGELWDLAHQAAHDLAKVPESSPEFSRLSTQTEALLDDVAQAFALAQLPEPEQATRLNTLREQITRHAQALGVGRQALLPEPTSAQPSR
ncbi:hypothetical protein [Deinococcus arcticus]|uniref:Uncharacterized protein n=1 Tax=Deinococcus arcticus TaxID=2136176 RepID=A0A2T3WBH3_9DEIO|nr:hypothetical protein [Deinococcus arcticus]PTA69260.1 hypothetical protein C8263_02660 [Deinococcus arcticus]